MLKILLNKFLIKSKNKTSNILVMIITLILSGCSSNPVVYQDLSSQVQELTADMPEPEPKFSYNKRVSLTKTLARALQAKVDDKGGLNNIKEGYIAHVANGTVLNQTFLLGVNPQELASLLYSKGINLTEMSLEFQQMAEIKTCNNEYRKVIDSGIAIEVHYVDTDYNKLFETYVFQCN